MDCSNRTNEEIQENIHFCFHFPSFKVLQTSSSYFYRLCPRSSWHFMVAIDCLHHTLITIRRLDDLYFSQVVFRQSYTTFDLLLPIYFIFFLRRHRKATHVSYSNVLSVYKAI